MGEYTIMRPGVFLNGSCLNPIRTCLFNQGIFTGGPLVRTLNDHRNVAFSFLGGWTIYLYSSDRIAPLSLNIWHAGCLLISVHDVEQLLDVVGVVLS